MCHQIVALVGADGILHPASLLDYPLEEFVDGQIGISEYATQFRTNALNHILLPVWCHRVFLVVWCFVVWLLLGHVSALRSCIPDPSGKHSLVLPSDASSTPSAWPASDDDAVWDRRQSPVDKNLDDVNTADIDDDDHDNEMRHAQRSYPATPVARVFSFRLRPMQRVWPALGVAITGGYFLLLVVWYVMACQDRSSAMVGPGVVTHVRALSCGFLLAGCW